MDSQKIAGKHRKHCFDPKIALWGVKRAKKGRGRRIWAYAKPSEKAKWFFYEIAMKQLERYCGPYPSNAVNNIVMATQKTYVHKVHGRD